MNAKNICIGLGAGIHLTDQDYQLCVKCEELGIDVIETMTEREYELISKVVKVLCYYHEKKPHNETKNKPLKNFIRVVDEWRSQLTQEEIDEMFD